MNTELSRTVPPNNRLVWVDFLRVISALLVALVHSEQWGGGPASAKALYQTAARISVPIFFMLSGYLLLQKEEGWRVFLTKRAAKVLIPLLAWSVIYDVYLNQAFSESGVTLEAIFDLFLRILKSSRAGHLWFMYSLVGLYFFIPILRIFTAHARTSDILYFIALWLFVMPGLFIAEAYTDLRIGFELQFAGGYVGYLLMGLLLGRLEGTTKQLWISAGIFLVSFVFCFFVFLYHYPKDNELPFRSHLSLNIIILSGAAFPLLKAIGEKIPERAEKLLRLFSDSSFGIYLAHPLIGYWVGLFWQAQGWKINSGSSFIVVPAMTLMIFLISFLLTYLLRKIPLLKSIVP